MTTTLDAPSASVGPARGTDRPARSDRAVPWVLFAVALAAYTATRAGGPTEWDSVSLMFGVDGFDVTQATPHAPGYWLYVFSGRVIRAITPLSTHDSLVAAGALAAAGTVALAYVLGRSLAGRWMGLAGAAVLFTSPFLAFYGSTVGSYAFDALASIVLLLLAWRATPGSWHGVAAAGALGLATGVRQSSIVLLGPLALVAAARSVRTWQTGARLAGAGLLGLMVWVVPMGLEQPGGLSAVSDNGARIWRESVTVSSPFYGAPGEGVRYNIGQATGYTLAAAGLLVPIAALAVALLLRRRAHNRRRALDTEVPAAPGSHPRRTQLPRPVLTPPVLLAIAAVPPFVFVTLFHFGKAGYVLSYLPALVLLLLWPVAHLPHRLRLGFTAVLGVVCLFQGQRFLQGDPGILPGSLTERTAWFTQSRFGAPYRLTTSAMSEVVEDTDRYRALAEIFDPERDVLVYVYMNGGHRYRHAMLTLPEFRVHLLQLGFHEYSGRGRRWDHERDHRLELAPGARAVLVVDEPRQEVLDMVAAGTAVPVQLTTGPTVYVVPAGVTVYGVPLVTDASATERRSRP
ncbi:MAG TPA: hypothetical protein VM142_00820 [Acidimicrobiales bacterium]|nr:hypothetical protein [Acidimicrobiales bacterium]